MMENSVSRIYVLASVYPIFDLGNWIVARAACPRYICIIEGRSRCGRILKNCGDGLLNIDRFALWVILATRAFDIKILFLASSCLCPSHLRSHERSLGSSADSCALSAAAVA